MWFVYPPRLASFVVKSSLFPLGIFWYPLSFSITIPPGYQSTGCLVLRPLSQRIARKTRGFSPVQHVFVVYSAPIQTPLTPTSDPPISVDFFLLFTRRRRADLSALSGRQDSRLYRHDDEYHLAGDFGDYQGYNEREYPRSHFPDAG
jgi:hypothetical protein